MLSICRALCRWSPSSGAGCTPMRRWAARPAVCPSLGTTWAGTPPCWSATCCWLTLGNIPVKSKVAGRYSGTGSTSSCWVSIVSASSARRFSYQEAQTHLYQHTLAHADIMSGSLAWHTSSVTLPDLMIHFNLDSVIWFRSGFIWIALMMRWDQKHRSRWASTEWIDYISIRDAGTGLMMHEV